jgi:hypothetical protein
MKTLFKITFSLFPLVLLLISPFLFANDPPSLPVIVFPANNAVNVNTNTSLVVNVSDPDLNAMTVTYYARPCPPPGADFTIIGLPDTQYYTGQLNGGTNAMYKSQMNWIINNRISENIVFMEGLGDCVQNGDGVVNEWKRADTCFKIIENPATTSLAYGLPYGINVGNHDQSPAGVAGGTTLFNTYFGTSRFTGRTYYGGHYGANNNNNYVLFSASGIDFIVINLEYNSNMPAALISWMQNLLTTYSNRKAIIGSHNIMSQALVFGAQGQTIYNAVKNYPNVLLMLCGHLTEEGKRQDTYNNNTITTLLSDYQARTNGGNGWMRIMKFSPANDLVSVKTYSPWLNQFETDTNSQFTFNCDLQTTSNYSVIGSNANVASGNTSGVLWSNLLPNTCYQWYALVNDGNNSVKSQVFKFTTGNNAGFPVTLNLKTFIEGFYKGSGNMASVSAPGICDTITVELHNSTSPFDKTISLKGVLNTNGNCILNFPSFVSGNSWYIVVKHRNSLETWSSSAILFNNATINYDFTTALNKAYGNNLKNLNDGRFAIYSGDVNQNGSINNSDYTLIENASHTFISNYNIYDLTGDNLVESVDYCFIENNIYNGIILLRP